MNGSNATPTPRTVERRARPRIQQEGDASRAPDPLEPEGSDPTPAEWAFCWALVLLGAIASAAVLVIATHPA